LINLLQLKTLTRLVFKKNVWHGLDRSVRGRKGCHLEKEKKKEK
jgi:hypothetical protein